MVAISEKRREIDEVNGFGVELLEDFEIVTENEFVNGLHRHCAK